MSNATTSTAFQVGQTYTATSACDHTCTFSFTVLARTAKFLTLASDSYNDGQKRVGVKTHDGAEYALPLGSYSMAPTIRPDRAA